MLNDDYQAVFRLAASAWRERCFLAVLFFILAAPLVARDRRRARAAGGKTRDISPFLYTLR